jgi:hypothetical protein
MFPSSLIGKKKFMDTCACEAHALMYATRKIKIEILELL